MDNEIINTELTNKEITFLKAIVEDALMDILDNPKYCVSYLQKKELIILAKKLNLIKMDRKFIDVTIQNLK